MLLTQIMPIKKQKSPLETVVLMRTDKQVLQFHKKEKSVT